MSNKTNDAYMDELNARAADNLEKERRQALEAARLERLQRATDRAEAKRKATRRFSRITLAYAVLAVTLAVAEAHGHVSTKLAAVAVILASTAQSLIAGAYFQFMWPKGGLFDGRN